VARVVDLKTPGSKESHRNLWSNLEQLTARDAVKIVICNRPDYEWARGVLAKQSLPCPVFFSPSHEELPAGTLADWILEDHLPVRMQVQLHKVLWGNVPGR
jgi:7-carboxy-7-deazaguanine synthase